MPIVLSEMTRVVHLCFAGDGFTRGALFSRDLLPERISTKLFCIRRSEVSLLKAFPSDFL